MFLKKHFVTNYIKLETSVSNYLTIYNSNLRINSCHLGNFLFMYASRVEPL